MEIMFWEEEKDVITEVNLDVVQIVSQILAILVLEV